MRRLLLAVTAAIVLACSGSAQAAVPLGFNDGWVQLGNFDPQSSPEQFRHVHSALARVTFDWNDTGQVAALQPTLDAMHKVRNGTGGIGTIITPYDDDGPVAQPNGAYQAGVCSAATEAAAANPGSPIEILNEANYIVAGSLSPGQYARLFVRCHRQIRNAGLNNRILASSVVNTVCTSTGETWQNRFARLTSDVRYTLSVHIYLSACSPDQYTPADVAADAINDARNAPGNAERKVWVTEAGYEADGRGTSDSEQDAWVGGFAREALSLNVRRFYVHRLYDPRTTPDPWGIYRSYNGTWKPVADTLRALF